MASDLDRRILGTADLPSQLHHDDTLIMDYAYVFAFPDMKSTPVKDAVSELFLAAAEVQAFYDSSNVITALPFYEQNEDKYNIQIVPNPVQSVVEIILDGSELSGKAVFTLSNMQGQQVYTNTITKKASRFDLSALSSGVYMYSIREGSEQLKTGKIVISK